MIRQLMSATDEKDWKKRLNSLLCQNIITLMKSMGAQDHPRYAELQQGTLRPRTNNKPINKGKEANLKPKDTVVNKPQNSQLKPKAKPTKKSPPEASPMQPEDSPMQPEDSPMQPEDSPMPEANPPKADPPKADRKTPKDLVGNAKITDIYGPGGTHYSRRSKRLIEQKQKTASACSMPESIVSANATLLAVLGRQD